MARFSAVLLLAAACSADLIIKEPISSKTGAEKLLIIINGAYVENTNYEDVGVAIQEASDLKLWIAIPSFLLNCPNPGEIGSKVSSSISTVKSRGFTNITSGSDVIIGGHSLGGIFSQQVVASGDYAGLILFGSYLTTIYGYSLTTFKKPVLTLAGELDGLTRITRIAAEWRAMHERITADGQEALYRFPVVALPGQTHSQFCSNVNVTSFGTKDLMAAVSWDSAHAAIGEAVSNYLTLVTDSTDSAARSYIDAKYTYTKGLLAGFLAAQDEEGSWCAQAQKVNAANVSTSLTVNTTTVGNFASFDVAYPSITASSKLVNVVTELQYALNPTDSSLTADAATEIDCKMMTEASILSALGQNATVGSQGCMAANEAALTRGSSLLPDASLKRYQSEGKPFVIKADSVYSTGVTWQAGSFGFSTTSSNVEVQSPLLTTGDDVLCKLLAPSKVVEYMMVDGLPRFDGTVI